MLIFHREMLRFYWRECHGHGEDDGILQSSKGRFSKIDIVGLSRFGRRGCMAGGPELGQISGSLILKVLFYLSECSEFIYWKLDELSRDYELLMTLERTFLGRSYTAHATLDRGRAHEGVPAAVRRNKSRTLAVD